MNATRDLIAAALRLTALAERNTDDRDEWQHSISEVREMCARAMVQPDMAEVEKRLCIHENVVRMHANGAEFDKAPSATRTALLDYVRGVLAELEHVVACADAYMAERDQFRDAAKMVDVPEIRFGNMLDCRTCAHFTSDGCHSTAVCIDAQQHKATSPRQYWTAAPQPVGAAEVPMPKPASGHARIWGTGDLFSEAEVRTYAEYSAALDALAGVRQPLTNEQIEAIWKAHVLPGFGDRQKFYSPIVYARAIEAAHGIGGLSPEFMQAHSDEAPRLDLGA